MPPQDIETDITNPLERFFTLAAGIDHMESRSLLGVSIIKVYFQPGTDADADVTELSNSGLGRFETPATGHAAARGVEVRRIQPARLPGDAERRRLVANPASRHRPVHHSQSNCGGERRRDSSAVRRKVSPGDGLRGSLQAALAATQPDGCGGRAEQEQPDSSRWRREDGAVRLLRLLQQPGEKVADLNKVPIKTKGQSWVSIGDIGEAKDANQIQYNIVRVDGQRSVYLPIMKQGGDTNTIQVVNGIRDMLGKLFDIPRQLEANVVFDQSAFVKEAIRPCYMKA